jgi:hypothetical protein
MKPALEKPRRLWTRRGVLGLLGVLMGGHRWVWAGSLHTKPKLATHEADYYRPLKPESRV